MCGLCGVYGFIGMKEKTAFLHLQMFSQLRGTDSTGVACVFQSKAKEPVIYKSIGGLEHLVHTHHKNFDRDWEINEVGLKCLIGHHRKATIGEVTEDNAHPFEYDSIIGCHNGTIYKHELKKLESYSDDLIDSQIVLEEINRTGEIKDVIKNITGAWAFVWWDKANDNLNICRNDKRTVCIAYSEDQRTLFWASEDWMLHQALKRSGIKYNGRVGILKHDKHFAFEITIGGKVEMIKAEEAKGGTFVNPTMGGTSGGRAGFKYDDWTYPKLPPAPPSQSKNNVVPLQQTRAEPHPAKPLVKTSQEEFEELYTPGFLGEFLNKRRYLHLTKDGCTSCETPLSWEDRKKVKWLDQETPLCSKCSEHFKDELDEIEETRVEVNSARSVH